VGKRNRDGIFYNEKPERNGNLFFLFDIFQSGYILKMEYNKSNFNIMEEKMQKGFVSELWKRL